MKARSVTRTQFFRMTAGALTGMALAGAAVYVHAADSVQCGKSGKVLI